MRLLVALLLLMAGLVGCLGPLPTTPVVEPTTSAITIPTPKPTVPPTAVAEPTLAPPSGPRKVIILHTSDEHGYLLPEKSGDFLSGGAGYCFASWLKDGIDPRTDADVLLLSGGDNWTGPAISSWFEGESTVEVMNAMGYRASILGNHEFDFGQEVLAERIAQADFPFLAANLFMAGTDQQPNGVLPYVMETVNGVRVGIVGLALKGTPKVTASRNLTGLVFRDYEPALRRWVTELRAQGAQLVIVESHICPQDLVVLAGKVADLEIDLFAGGHCHQSRLSVVKGSLVVACSAHWQDYVRVTLHYDEAQGGVFKAEKELVDVLTVNSGTQPALDPAVQAVIDKWDARAQLVVGEVIGYSKTGLMQHSPRMHNLLVDSWLWALSQGDVAISNTGGYRESIPPGEITLADVIGVFPFDNQIYQLEVEGRDILDALQKTSSDITIGGLRFGPGDEITVVSTGKRLDPDAPYHLLVTDYMYHNSKYPFMEYDSDPYETSVHWRQPVIDWIKVQHSSVENPIEGRIDDREDVPF